VATAGFAVDGRVIAFVLAGADVKVRELTGGSTSYPTLKGHTDNVITLHMSPDGRHVATGSKDKTAKVWNVESGTLVWDLAGHEGQVNGVAFSVDGKVLAPASADKTVTIWNLDTGKQ